jgi:hypothetical protein
MPCHFGAQVRPRGAATNSFHPISCSVLCCALLSCATPASVAIQSPSAADCLQWLEHVLHLSCVCAAPLSQLTNTQPRLPTRPRSLGAHRRQAIEHANHSINRGAWAWAWAWASEPYSLCVCRPHRCATAMHAAQPCFSFYTCPLFLLSSLFPHFVSFPGSTVFPVA